MTDYGSPIAGRTAHQAPNAGAELPIVPEIAIRNP